MKIRALMLIALLLTTGQALAARVELRDGSVIVGDILSNQGGNYTIRMGSGQVLTVPANTVVRVSDAAAPAPSGNTAPAAPAPAAGSINLRFAGSNTIGDKLMPALILDYIKHKGATGATRSTTGVDESVVDVRPAVPGLPAQIPISAKGSGTAFTALKADAAEIGMSSRPINPTELGDLAPKGDMTAPESEHVLALDGLAIIVNPANQVSNLSKEVLARIFTGEIKDWSAVGGRPGPVTVYARDGRSGTFDTFKHLVLNGKQLVEGAKRFESSEELSNLVARDPGAIGFVGFAYVGQSRSVPIAECKLTYPATPFTVKTEEYPLSRRLFLYTPAQHSGLVSDFIAYTGTSQGQALVAQEGFIDLGITPDTAKTQDARRLAATSNVGRWDTVQDFLATTDGATRLSVTFRFRRGSAKLDNRALSDIGRLKAYLQSAEGRGRQVMLLGFTDSDGVYAANVELSQRRARSIADQFAPFPIQVKGFGPEAPVSCNDNDAGKENNRHVEVWIR